MNESGYRKKCLEFGPQQTVIDIQHFLALYRLFTFRKITHSQLDTRMHARNTCYHEIERLVNGKKNVSHPTAF